MPSIDPKTTPAAGTSFFERISYVNKASSEARLTTRPSWTNGSHRYLVGRNRQSDLLKSSVFRGYRAPLPFTREIYYAWVQPTSGYAIYRDFAGWWFQQRSDYGLTPTVSTIDALFKGATYNDDFLLLEQEATLVARNRLKNARVAYGEAIAESRKTVLHLAQSALRLAKWIGWALKGQWNSIRLDLGITRGRHKDAGSLSANWLEYQYAWRPLMGEIYGTVQLLQEGLVKDDQVIYASSRRWRNKRALYEVIKGTRVLELNLGMQVAIHARVKDADVAGLTALGLTDPLQVMWAVVPFSFVVDWFFPVSDFLESIGATKGLSFQGGCQTRKVYLEPTDLAISEVTVSSNTPLVRSEGKRTIQVACNNTYRTVYTTWPFAVPVLSRSPLLGMRSANAVALLAQQTREIRGLRGSLRTR